jgi:hypothetical protein
MLLVVLERSQHHQKRQIKMMMGQTMICRICWWSLDQYAAAAAAAAELTPTLAAAAAAPLTMVSQQQALVTALRT